MVFRTGGACARCNNIVIAVRNALSSRLIIIHETRAVLVLYIHNMLCERRKKINSPNCLAPSARHTGLYLYAYHIIQGV